MSAEHQHEEPKPELVRRIELLESQVAELVRMHQHQPNDGLQPPERFYSQSPGLPSQPEEPTVEHP